MVGGRRRRRGGTLREHGAGGRDSDEELAAEIARTEKAIDNCYRRRARRAGVELGELENRLLNKEERDKLSERLGNGEGARAKRRREIEEMQLETLEAEGEEAERTRARRRTTTGASKLGCLPLALTIVCLMGGPASAFTAYDCSNRSNVIESYSFLEPDACANTGKEGEVETTVYGEIVEIKQDRMILVFRCLVIETIVSQYCGHFSSAGVTRYIRLRETKSLEAWECRQAKKNMKVVINGRTLQAKMGATVPHAMFLSGAMDDDSNCETGIISFPNGKTLGGQTAQGLYEVTLREEFARLNELTGSLTLTSGVQARAGDKSMVDSLEGTVVWEYDSIASPQTIVQLYRGLMKMYVNQSGVYKGSTTVVEHQDKDQAAGLEMADSFILCSHQAFKTHIKSIAVFIHKDDRMEVAQGRFTKKEG